MAGIAPVSCLCFVLAYFASYQNAFNDSVVLSIRSSCALRSASLVTLALQFLEARYTSDLSFLWCLLYALYSRFNLASTV